MSDVTDPDIPVLPGLTAVEAERLMMSVGTHRTVRPLQPLDVAVAINTSLSAGATKRLISNEIGLSESMIDGFLSLLKLGPRIGAMVGWARSRAKIAMWTGIQLSQLDLAQQDTLANAVIQHDLKSEEVRAILQRTRRSTVDLDSAISEIIARRPVVRTTVVCVGSVKESALVDTLVTRTQSERDVLLRRTLRLLTDGNIDEGTLAPMIFTVVADEAAFGRYFSSPDVCADKVVDALRDILGLGDE